MSAIKNKNQGSPNSSGRKGKSSASPPSFSGEGSTAGAVPYHPYSTTYDSYGSPHPRASPSSSGSSAAGQDYVASTNIDPSYYALGRGSAGDSPHSANSGRSDASSGHSGYGTWDTSQETDRPSKRIRGPSGYTTSPTPMTSGDGFANGTSVASHAGSRYSSPAVAGRGSTNMRSSTTPGHLSYDSNMAPSSHMASSGQIYPHSSSLPIRGHGQQPFYPGEETHNIAHPPTELPPRPYPAVGGATRSTKPRATIPGSALDFLPLLEQRFERLEGAVDQYVEHRARQALDKSIIPGLDKPERPGYSDYQQPSSRR